METFSFPTKNKKTILALGAESAGNFSVYCPAPYNQKEAGVHFPLPCNQGRAGEGFRAMNDTIHFSQDFGDLLDEANFTRFKKSVLAFLKKENLTPDIILTDLHPLMKTTLWGKALARKYKAGHIQVQHHHAHIFSSVGECLTSSPVFKQRLGCIAPSPVLRGGLGRGYGADGQRKIPHTFYGIAMDGTGYGEDEKIWGGECFAISNFQFPISNQFSNSNDKISKQKICVQRIGHLENQIMIGGELAIREPARMLIAILNKVFSASSPSPVLREGVSTYSSGRRGWERERNTAQQKKDLIYPFIKKYYTRNEFGLLHNQLEQNFNCAETSSAGRVLDAVSLLLGFCGNERKYKHAPIELLEKNSTTPYKDLEPKIARDANGQYILDTSYLFNYVINYLHKKDKRRLAATAQLYIAEGLHEIIQKHCPLPCTQGRAGEGLREVCNIFFSGGLANNRIISDYLISQGAYTNEKVYPVNSNEFNGVPRGDAGLSFGQVIYYLFS
ncbi:MAG: hypothetical protein WC022_02105 [Parcubacteria group bacterium]